MKTLDEQIDDIEQLDALRREAQKLRQEAIEALTAGSYGPNPRPADGPAFDKAKKAWEESKRKDWRDPADEVEKAQVLHALRIATATKEGNPERQADSIEALIRDLGAIRFNDLHGIPENLESPEPFDHIPMLRSAYLLQALAGIPDYALSHAALACFCRIVEELNWIVDPTWAAGAARGDDKSLATAFVTGECARGLVRLEMALRNTATAAELLGKAAARDKEPASTTDIWGKQEKRFRQYSLNISLGALSHSIIEFKKDAKGELAQTPEQLLKAIAAALGKIPEAKTVMILSKPASTDGAAPASATLPAASSASEPDSIPLERMRKIISDKFAKTARAIAEEALDHLRKTLKPPADSDNPEKFGESLASKLRDGAQILRDLMSPMEQFAESAIDRQIAAASPHLSVPVDAAELLFAANLFGMVTNWKRPKVRAAYELLYPLLSSNGRLLSIRPFAVGLNGPNGYRLNVATLEVTRRIANLVANLDVEPEPEFVARLMLPFEYTRVPGDRAKSGWTTDPPSRESKSVWWLTAIALDALDSVVHMLDKTINRRVLRQFHVRQPESLSLKLDDLFYPDYGLAWFYQNGGLTAKPENNSIAIELQRLRAHAGDGLPEKDPLFSLILYGPPGTGKTTLVEALAASAGAPLVEITPSDILVGGAEGMERRARQVFQALSKLTHVVILFDEFDSILLDRTIQQGKMPTSVIEFLTPGMLPKLKALHDASKDGRMSYVLATNYLDRLDSAVTREGRFDQKCGVYPPDVVSRVGRLRDQLRVFTSRRNRQYLKEQEKWQKLAAADPAQKDRAGAELKDLQSAIATNQAIADDKKGEVLKRIMEAAERTAGGPMSTLGQRGWYTAPQDEAKAKGKIFGYLLNKDNDFKDVDREANYDREKASYDEKNKTPSEAGELYWKQWEQIRRWDTNFRITSTDKSGWEDLIEDADRFLKR